MSARPKQLLSHNFPVWASEVHKLESLCYKLGLETTSILVISVQFKVRKRTYFLDRAKEVLQWQKQ